MHDTPQHTSGETYFFRDHGQFDELRLRLLPELIKRRRHAKTLRLWSAGCSTGEEPYSLAILVDMLLPQREGWDILILGSDINSAALAQARRGSYRQWSFRMAGPTLQQRYFRPQGNQWQLEERIRAMVTFRACDLIRDPIPGGDMQEMDLILCRNVFIYFAADVVTGVAAKLAGALSRGGYLMTGHAELIGHGVRNLHSRLLTEGVVYQRLAAGATSHPSTPSHPASPPRVRPIPHPPPVEPRVPGQPPPVPCVVVPAVPREDLLATAREFADRGEYDLAEHSCNQALAVTPLSAKVYFLLAQLAQLRGNFKHAATLLDKSIYLDPHHVAAYLEQAALCERAENLVRARTLRRAALNIVRTLPDDTMIEPYDITAAEMAQWLAQ
jgi:chemotaxis protein methyltransferase CheR